MVSVASRLNVHPSLLIRPAPKCKSPERVVVHIDMDCFFASIAVTKNSALRGKCIAICHGAGEISSCSYEARAYGVKAGMFFRNARKLCPQLMSVPYDFALYEKVSVIIYSFFHDYPGICVEAVSVDEAYLDITNTIASDISQSNAEQLVKHLRDRIEMETGCTASAGIGPSKLVARLATKGAKPNGQLRVRQEDVIRYLDTLSVRDLPGIGWRTNKRLAAMNITTVPQLRAQSLTRLQDEFGERQGQVFHDLARALDSRPVEPLKPRKSIGAEASWGVRFENDETPKVVKFIGDIADEVASRVTAAGAYGKKITYKVYRKIPNSDMTWSKHLGHGPCSILTKSAKLPANCVGEEFKAVLREKCVDIHKKWKIRNDEFRGVGLQVTDLVFANLSFNHAALPVNGTRRIDTFFAATGPKEKEKEGNENRLDAERTQVEVQKIEDAVVKKTKQAQEVKRNDSMILSYNEIAIESTGRGGAVQQGAGEGDVDQIRPTSRGESNAEKRVKKRSSVENEESVPQLPDGWDKQVFQALPKELQTELLQGQNRGFARSNTIVNGVDSMPQIPAVPTIPSARIAGESEEPRRPAKRKRDSRNARAELQQSEKRTRRKSRAQTTMTQCADISELRKKGHEVLDAEEFREKPLREMVELLEDLQSRRRVVNLQSSKWPKAEKENESTRQEERAGARRVRINAPEVDGFDIPSPPSLSSDSESSYGMTGAIEKLGFEHTQIYGDEDIWDYAPQLKAWMHANANDIRTGHIELLRGRVLEMIHLKQLDRASSELRTIRTYADGDAAEMGEWKEAFNQILADVQNEVSKLYGFKLGVRPLCTD